MRRALLVAALAVGAAAPAQAEPFIYPPAEPNLPDPGDIVVCGYCPGDAIAALRDRLGDVTSAIAPAPEPEVTTSRQLAVAAYGEGTTTTCTFTLDKGARSFRGATSCNRSLAQTAQAWAGSFAGSSCSGVRTSCTSSGTSPSAYTTLRYRVTLQAPAGQGWVAPPSECSGGGTDRLDCTFTF